VLVVFVLIVNVTIWYYSSICSVIAVEVMTFCGCIRQIALDYVKKYGVKFVRVLTLEKNRGKGGAVRMVC